MREIRHRGMSIAIPRGSLVTAVVEFCRLLNESGIAIVPGASQHALPALREINITRRAEFRAALRISLLKKPEDIPLFNFLFATYWRADNDDAGLPEITNSEVQESQERSEGELESESADHDSNETEINEAGSTLGEESQRAGDNSDDDDGNQFAPAARWGARPGVNSNNQSEPGHVELDRVARALAAELALRRSRRKERNRHGQYIDFRNLMRKSLRYGGLPVTLSWRRPRITRAQLLIFCDVSRSMEQHAKLLLQFARAVFRHAWRVEVFLFANHIVRVTDRWLESEWTDLTRSFADCGGGTEIGESLETFISDYDYCLTGSKSTIIILSDGLDAGDPAKIDRTLAQLKRRSRQVIWLNPLLATNGYEPTARGMAAAIPYIDVFAPAHNVNSFWQMIEYLRSGQRVGDRNQNLGASTRTFSRNAHTWE